MAVVLRGLGLGDYVFRSHTHTQHLKAEKLFVKGMSEKTKCFMLETRRRVIFSLSGLLRSIIFPLLMAQVRTAV